MQENLSKFKIAKPSVPFKRDKDREYYGYEVQISNNMSLINDWCGLNPLILSQNYFDTIKEY